MYVQCRCPRTVGGPERNRPDLNVALRLSMFYGTIKTISERGFGFIGQEGGPDVYFHASILPPEEFARLRPEQPVMFELAKRDPDQKPSERKGPRAAKVQLIERMPGGRLAEEPLTPPAHKKAKFRKAKWKRRIDVSGGARDDRAAEEGP